MVSAAPAGLAQFVASYPQLETVGYCQMFLRNNCAPSAFAPKLRRGETPVLRNGSVTEDGAVGAGDAGDVIIYHDEVDDPDSIYLKHHR